MAVSFNIFALKDDLKKIFSEYEKAAAVKYYKCGAFENNEKSTAKSLAAYKNLGISISGVNGDNKFLVMKANNTCKFNEVINSNNEVKYYIDDLRNKKTFTIDLQGVFQDKIIKTVVNTIYDNDNEIFKIFIQTCEKYCIRCDNDFIGIYANKAKNNYQFI